jgi:hypothetical protein
MDMNDRALRRISVEVDGKRDGANRHTGFVITAASEIMAILALAKAATTCAAASPPSSSAQPATATPSAPPTSTPPAP